MDFWFCGIRDGSFCWLGVIAHPSAEWIARQLTEACGWSEPPSYIIRDRDSAYREAYIRRLRAIGIRDRPISAGITSAMLAKDALIPREAKRAGRVLAQPILGGLHHRYVRV